jgi:hypothetical protein
MRVANRILAAGSLAALTACADANGPVVPESEFNARRVQEGIAVVEQVGNHPVLKSFQAIGAHSSGVAAAGSASNRFIAAVRTVAGIVRPDVNAAFIPIIRGSMLGKTLIYDPASDRYVVAPGRTGAPANGVRFVLYEVEEETGKPIASEEIGHSDLIDAKAGSPTSAGLRLIVVSNGKTYLDYGFDLSGTIATAVVTVAGFMSDGTERVNFNITTTGQLFGRGGTAVIDARLEVPSHDFKVAAKVTGEAGSDSGDGEVELTVTAGSDVVALDAHLAGASVQASVKVNGATFATITGTKSNPVIRGENGRELTAEELAGLGQVFEFAEGIFALIGGLLQPVGVLLLIGLGL